jgi:cell division protein FtsB
MDEMQEALSELYKRRRELAEQISSEFGDGDFFESNEKYQSLLREVDEINEQIKDFHNDGY